jgi:hypothetical protein
MENHDGMISAGENDLPIRALSGNPTSSHLEAMQEEPGEENYEFGLIKYLSSYFKGIFNMP